MNIQEVVMNLICKTGSFRISKLPDLSVHYRSRSIPFDENNHTQDMKLIETFDKEQDDVHLNADAFGHVLNLINDSTCNGIIVMTYLSGEVNVISESNGHVSSQFFFTWSE